MAIISVLFIVFPFSLLDITDGLVRAAKRLEPKTLKAFDLVRNRAHKSVLPSLYRLWRLERPRAELEAMKRSEKLAGQRHGCF